MQEYLNLEEAAQQLGIGKEELAKKAQRREIRAFADRGTWKFRKQDIEEHARQAGIGSGAEIVFGELEDELPTLESGSADQILLNEQSLSDSSSGPGSSSGSGRRVIGMDEFGRTPSDSDVRLVPEGKAKGSDSDVKLVGGVKPPSDSDVKVVAAPDAAIADSDVKIKGPTPTDSDVRLDRVKAPGDSGVCIASPVSPAKGSEATQGLPAFAGVDDEALEVTSGSSSDQGGEAGSDSDAELVTTDSDSDFELGTQRKGSVGDSDMTLALDDHVGLVPDEIKLAPRSPSESDLTAGSPSSSGLSLSSPADSGIALDEAPSRSRSGSGRGVGASDAAKPASDIFETDFEVPVLDSDQGSSGSGSSDTEQLSADSDFELSGSDLEGGSSDSASQVLSLEGEEQVDEAAATRLQAAPQEEQWEEDLDVEGEPEFAEDSGAVATPSRTFVADESGASAPALVTAGAAETEWGGLWVGWLCFNTVLMVLLGMVMFDLVRTMWGWEEGRFLFYESPMLNWMKGLVPK